MNNDSRIGGSIWRTIKTQTGGSPAVALGELVDNAIDAGATELDINTSKPNQGRVSVTDNGTGMSLEQIDKNFFHFGSSNSHGDASKSGSYGFGAKAGLCFFGDKISVASVKNGTHSKMDWDISKDIRSDVFGAGVKKHLEKKTKKANGTIVSVSQERIINTVALSQNLSWQFRPAIQRGIIIRLNGQQLVCSELPWKETPAEYKGEIDGQAFSILCGQIEKPKDWKGLIKSGVNVEKLHRFVPKLTGWTDPVEDSPLCVMVKLLPRSGEDWQLDAVKQDLSEKSLKSRLHAAIAELCNKEIAQFQDAAEEVEIKNMTSRLEQRVQISGIFVQDPDGKFTLTGQGKFTEAFGRKRGKNSGKEDPLDTVIEEGEKPKREKPKKNGIEGYGRDAVEGNTHSSAGGRITFKFQPMDDVWTAVKFIASSGHIQITFNKDCPFYVGKTKLSIEDDKFYMLAAAQALSQKMQDDPGNWVPKVGGWQGELEKNGWDYKTQNIHSKFINWFSRKVLSPSVN